jgi:hypothetical protein
LLHLEKIMAKRVGSSGEMGAGEFLTVTEAEVNPALGGAIEDGTVAAEGAELGGKFLLGLSRGS